MFTFPVLSIDKYCEFAIILRCISSNILMRDVNDEHQKIRQKKIFDMFTVVFLCKYFAAKNGVHKDFIFYTLQCNQIPNDALSYKLNHFPEIIKMRLYNLHRL